MSEIMTHLKKMEEVAAKSEDVAAELEGWERVFQFQGEGVKPFYITIKDGKLKVSEGTYDNPDLTMEANYETMLGMLTGDIDATSAYMSGDLKVIGALPDAVKFRTVIEIIRDEME
ncbi:MAG: SCP2 sterol-binding domain-containing protein [Candidatus Freyarchaeota archaeon]|nr:SCP2 sterol-binding domain-containing protein [Candidatus Jordarchaeia archaeon]MBS7268145.1 SCP2 sterol-binding domain-containing protein [Candidatus Jordarchaeia archaeon]MBS7278603.1 SCP2 sterol-binding domain-containing protein [Candidatus Jordarchaeia archaeon]